jgi:membrane-bound lytic murein transglycosylase A
MIDQPFPAVARGLSIALLLLTLTGLVACRSAAPLPDYARPLPPGEPALRVVDGPVRAQVLQTAAEQLADAALVTALGRSADWFRVASTQEFFPIEGISHDRARRSVERLLEISEIGSARVRADRLRAEFDLLASVGYDSQGTVLYTGYFSPEYSASRTRGGTYQFPLYRRPPGHAVDAGTGTVLGRRLSPDRGPTVYPPRNKLETSGELAGLELVYLPSRLDAYSIEVNGSAKLQLTGGGTMYVGFAGTNGHAYTSIGRLLVADGVLDADTVSMPAIRRHFQQNPRQLDDYIRQNDRFVFFQEYPGTEWPAGSLGFRVTPQRSVATDKKIFPRGGAVFVSTTLPDGRPYRRLMLDQDTGGAIRAPGRADLYFGIGPQAEQVSGRQAAEGRLFYLFLKR